MEKKPMGKKTALIVLAGVLVAAVLLGFLLLNKGDGPVTGMILSNQAIETTQGYADAEKSHGDGVYLVVSNAFNQFQENYKAEISQGSGLFATVHFVECPKGSVFTAKWSRDGVVLAQETAALTTEPQGVIAYPLAMEAVTSGGYTFALYNGDQKIFEHTFQIV